MSTTLEPQIRDLSQAFEATIDPVTIDELLVGIQSATVGSARRRRPAWVTAVAIAAIVLLPLIIIAGLWIDDDPADEITTTTVPQVTTTTVADGTTPTTLPDSSLESFGSPQAIQWETLNVSGAAPRSVLGEINGRLVGVTSGFEWTEVPGVFAADLDGDPNAYLHVSTNAIDWQRMPLPEALGNDRIAAAVADGLLWVATYGYVAEKDRENPGLWFSSDGETWTQSSFSPPLEARWDQVFEIAPEAQPSEGAHLDPLYWNSFEFHVHGNHVLIPTKHGFWVSDDGGANVEWIGDPIGIEAPFDTQVGFQSLWVDVYDGGFVALAHRSLTGGVEVLTSPDGRTWTSQGDAGVRMPSSFGSMAADGDRLVLASKTKAWTGTPGGSFDLVLDGELDDYPDVRTAFGGFLIATDSGIFTSPDGLQWSPRQEVGAGWIDFVEFGDRLVWSDLSRIVDLGPEVDAIATPAQPTPPVVRDAAGPPNLQWTVLDIEDEIVDGPSSRVAVFGGKAYRVNNGLEFVCDFEPAQCSGTSEPSGGFFQDMDGQPESKLMTFSGGLWIETPAPAFMQDAVVRLYAIGDELFADVEMWSISGVNEFWSTTDLETWERIPDDQSPGYGGLWAMVADGPRAVGHGRDQDEHFLKVKTGLGEGFVRVADPFDLSDDHGYGFGLSLAASDTGFQAIVERAHGAFEMWESSDGFTWTMTNPDLGFRQPFPGVIQPGTLLRSPEGRLVFNNGAGFWIETAAGSGAFTAAQGGEGTDGFESYVFSDFMLVPGNTQMYASVDGEAWYPVMPSDIASLLWDGEGGMRYSTLYEIDGVIYDAAGRFTIERIG